MADALGSLGLVVFALTAWASPPASGAAFALCLFAAVLSPQAGSALLKDPLLRFGMWCGIYLLAQTVRGAVQFPETLARQVADGGKWLLMLGFPVVGWWLRADLRRINLVLMASGFGLGLGLLNQAHGPDILAFRTGHQTGFQMSAGCSGLISATVILGLLLFSGRIFRAPLRLWQKAFRALAWGIGMYLSVYMLVASQSRTAWGAALIVFPAVLGYRYFLSVRARGFSFRRLPYLHLIILGLIMGGVWLNKESLLSRIGPDKETFATILQGNAEHLRQVPESSMKYRYQVQKFGLEKWLERPWTGWGTGSSRYLIRTAGRNELRNAVSGKWIGHLHSAYLEILVRFGLLGALLFAAGAWRVAKSLSGAELARRMPEDYRFLFLGALGMTVIWASNVFVLLSEQWRAYWLLLMGMGYTFTLHSASPALITPPARDS